jgi:hypothetical protein
MITHQQLRDVFLPAPMKYYFDQKLKPLPSNEVNVRVEELLKALNMSLFAPGDIPFSLEIDEVWHLWIMETHEYAKLCTKLHGGQFLHHSSNTYAEFFDVNAKQRTADFEQGLGILSSYVLNYGPFTEDRIAYWPLAVQILKDTGWTLLKFNDWLLSAAAAPQEHATGDLEVC